MEGDADLESAMRMLYAKPSTPGTSAPNHGHTMSFSETALHSQVSQNTPKADAVEEEANWQPAQEEGGLPITSWTDALSGKIDSEASCTHVRDQITVAEERFKANTKRALEKAYGVKQIVDMEASLQASKNQLNEQLERSGCFRQDPTGSSISALAVWHGANQGVAACQQLFQQRSKLAATYQDQVRSMMLQSKDAAWFTKSVDQLYSVTQSLHLRLQGQGCEGPSAGPAPSPPVAYPPVAYQTALQQTPVQRTEESMTAMRQELHELQGRVLALTARMNAAPSLLQLQATSAPSAGSSVPSDKMQIQELRARSSQLRAKMRLAQKLLSKVRKAT